MDRLRLGLFAISAPLLVAQERGIFTSLGLEVVVENVESSDQQFRDFAAGGYEMIGTAFDNVANYRLNTSHPLGRKLDVTAVIALDLGMNLSLVGDPSITSIEDIRGKRVSVDAVSSGFAFVLYALLQQAGLGEDDYTVVSHGGAAARWDRLKEGDADATLLSGGLEVVAAAHGFTTVATVADVVSPYLGGVVATSSDWALGHADVLARFRAAYDASLALVTDGREHDTIVREMQNAQRVSAEFAAALFAAQLGPLGISATADIPEEAAANTLLLRSRFNGFDEEVDTQALSRNESAILTLR